MVDQIAQIRPSARVIHTGRITLLGTGTSQGVPVIGCDCKVCHSQDPRDHRLRTAAHITLANVHIALDIGPDFRLQMLRHQLDRVDAILVTHEHNDHISGLDDLRPINFKSQKRIPLYSLQRTLDELERRFYYAFDPYYPYPGKPSVDSVAITSVPFFIGNVRIQPLPVDHGGLPILGYRIGSLAYITDAKSISPAVLGHLEDIDVLILNALRYTSHPTHLNVEEAISVIRQIRPKVSYLTHISHDMGLTEEVNDRLPEDISLGYDGLTVEFRYESVHA